MSGPQCAEFDEVLEELAIGDLAEPAQSRMLAHAATCRECRGRLDALLGLTDSLLTLAPQHEPPPGFESRVLERFGALQRSSGRNKARRRWVQVAAAVALVAALIGGFALGRRGQHAAEAVVSSGPIITTTGAPIGAIQLVSATHPYALVTIDRPRPGDQIVTCELQFAGGRTVTVGSWGYDDVKASVWAVGIDLGMLDAVLMRIVDEHGTVLATASLG